MKQSNNRDFLALSLRQPEFASSFSENKSGVRSSRRQGRWNGAGIGVSGENGCFRSWKQEF
jgi:hypothetical protein